MKLNSELERILLEIDFIQKYHSLSNRHRLESTEKITNYDVSKVLELLEDYGVEAKYNKTENFFKIVKQYGEVKFQFNISLKYGLCEFIWALWIDGKIERLGPWTLITRLIDQNQPPIKKPKFTSYNELNQILKESLTLFDEFIVEVQNNLNQIKTNE